MRSAPNKVFIRAYVICSSIVIIIVSFEVEHLFVEYKLHSWWPVNHGPGSCSQIPGQNHDWLVPISIDVHRISNWQLHSQQVELVE